MDLDKMLKMSFCSVVKPLVSAEKDKYLSLASSATLAKFLPKVDSVDLLPIAFNACVVGRGNKNGDVLGSEQAIASYKNFLNKPINFEHDREKIVGVLLTSGFTKFGTNEALDEAQAAEMKSPYNIVLGGVFWRIADPKLANIIEDSSDPESLNFNSVSASWELGFTNYKIAKLPLGDKNLEDAEVIDNIDMVASLANVLKGLGGTGSDGEFDYYRMPIGTVVPLGIGLTASPAAEVRGITTMKTNQPKEVVAEFKPFVKKDSGSPDDKEKTPDAPKGDESKEKKSADEPKKETGEEDSESCPDCKEGKMKSMGEKKTCTKCGKHGATETLTSQSAKSAVIKTEVTNTMKISKISDITDDSLKQLTASVITDFMAEADKAWQAAKTKDEETLKALRDEVATLKASSEAIKTQLDAVNKEKADAIAIASFNKHMAMLDEKFSLTDGARKVFLEDIKAASTDELFAAWMTKMNDVLVPFAIVANTPAAGKQGVVDNALDGATKVTASIPNAAEAGKKNKWSDVLKAGTFSVK